MISTESLEISAWRRRLEPVILKSWELAHRPLDQVRRLTDDGEDWLAVTLSDRTVLASDDFSELGRTDPGAAVIYPELDSRLWAWWLTHAWSATELAAEASKAISNWNLASAATLTRSLLESVAAFAYEGRQIANAWRAAKALPPGGDRPYRVRHHLNSPLLRAFRATRLPGAPATLQRPNVLTWLSRLARDTACEEVQNWYAALSEAAHPSSQARILYSSLTLGHANGAKYETHFTYRPIGILPLGASDETTVKVQNFSREMVDCWLFSSSVLREVLSRGFCLAGDFTLTTGAAGLAGSEYLRGFWAFEPCQCGCDGAVDHSWGADAARFKLSTRGRRSRRPARCEDAADSPSRHCAGHGQTPR